MSEELVRIKEAGFGNRKAGKPCLFFTVEFEDGSCALQVLNAEDGGELLRTSKVFDVQDLKGMFCWVEREGDFAGFKRMWGEMP